MIKKIKK